VVLTRCHNRFRLPTWIWIHNQNLNHFSALDWSWHG
jgi:hypothetical protein